MKPIGVYVHFPWCKKKCPYCDFVSFGIGEGQGELDHRGYAAAVLAELGERNDVLEGRDIATVFFGGGTPSLWDPDELGRVLEGILGAAPHGPELEVTVECNPTSLDEGRARALLGVGVNRLSVGVQGLDPERLRFLGRLHDAEGGIAAVLSAIRAGVPRVSGDLIYGVGVSSTGPAQSPDEAAADVLAVASTGVTHVSAYSLTIESGTQFGELARRGRLPLASDDAVADSFLAVDEALVGRGFVHYEISNFARPGEEARHNLGYWRGRDYLGLGCGAFGTITNADGAATRSRNVTDPGRYMVGALAGMPIVESEEELDAETRLRERIMLGLRLSSGLDIEAAANDLGVSPWPDHRHWAAERLVRAGRLQVEGPRLKLPRSAWLFADGIAAELF